MVEPRTYPPGATSWVDVEPLDVEAATAFYGGLFGWTFSDVTPGDRPGRYVVAMLDGAAVAGVALPVEGTEPVAPSWNTYVGVEDVTAAARRVVAAGGRAEPGRGGAGDDGRWAACEDLFGAQFRVRQAGGLPGAQVVNSPGAWNFSDLHAADPSASAVFYSTVFGWSFEDLGFARMIRVPGYGDHLEATVDPDIRARQGGVSAPPGFADAIGWLTELQPGEQPHWHVTFTVADRDATAALAQRLGGKVVARTDSDWTRDALVSDPQGAVFTVSQFAPTR
jgi:uncharacterized protein